MIKPTIHMNGTGFKTLMEQYEGAYRALSDALEKLYECAPNGRDYYPQGNEAIRTAKKEHGARVSSLIHARDEIAQLIEYIDEYDPSQKN